MSIPARIRPIGSLIVLAGANGRSWGRTPGVRPCLLIQMFPYRLRMVLPLWAVMPYNRPEPGRTH
jgi:hypothetical protein